MPYTVKYKKEERNWGQHTLGDYVPGLDKAHEKHLDNLLDARWERKKERHAILKSKGYPVKPLRRGRKPNLYPKKKEYRMDDPKDVARVAKFPWFSRCWNRNRKARRQTPRIHPRQTTLLDFFPDLLYAPRHDQGSADHGLHKRFYMPHFREPRYVKKEEFCSNMANWAWEATRPPRKNAGNMSQLFYLNDFSFFDREEHLEAIDWSSSSFLPSDIIVLALCRQLQGFRGNEDFFRMFRLAPQIMDYTAVKMTHKIPSSHRFTGYLKQIGSERVKQFFRLLVTEARQLGLIKDQIHIWDGQFHETWLQKDKKRREGYPKFYGGTYNHGGAKVGVGVYQSTIVDWNGYCAIPLYTKVVPANRNENPVVRETVQKAYSKNPVPDYFLADRGPSGADTQNLCASIGCRPIMPLSSNVKNGVRETSHTHHHFYSRFIDGASDEIINSLYDVRTRVEEHYAHNDVVYEMRRIHGCGKEMTDISIYLTNCLGVLIPLTAFKIGRPDLMWSPSSFRDQPIHPERLFPQQYHELNNFRWDDEICISPRRYRQKIVEQMRQYQERKDL